MGATDRAIRMMDRFASCFHDERRADLIEREVATLVGQRVFGIALGYEDLNDHDELRHDPLMAVLAGKLEARREDCAPVAGKSTLNRLERSQLAPTRYHKISHNPMAIKRLLVDLFLEAHERAPNEIILDLDATDDPVHGEQVCSSPSCGALTWTRRLARWRRTGIVAQARRRWPRVRVLLRADSGFARDDLMAWCEANGVDFLFGLARNERLVCEIATELDLVAAKSRRRTGRPEHRFDSFMWTTRESWSCRRRVVAKAEWTQGEANPRFVVTSLRRDDDVGACPVNFSFLDGMRIHEGQQARSFNRNLSPRSQKDLVASRCRTYADGTAGVFNLRKALPRGVHRHHCG